MLAFSRSVLKREYILMNVVKAESFFFFLKITARQFTRTKEMPQPFNVRRDSEVPLDERIRSPESCHR
jgi:hypothetical protein